MSWKSLSIGLLANALLATAAGAADALPSPATTCEDIRASFDGYRTMPMDRFKSLMAAAGMDSPLITDGFDTLCEDKGSRHLELEPSGRIPGLRHIGARVVVEDGVCRLTKIALVGC